MKPNTIPWLLLHFLTVSKEHIINQDKSLQRSKEKLEELDRLKESNEIRVKLASFYSCIQQQQIQLQCLNDDLNSIIDADIIKPLSDEQRSFFAELFRTIAFLEGNHSEFVDCFLIGDEIVSETKTDSSNSLSLDLSLPDFPEFEDDDSKIATSITAAEPAPVANIEYAKVIKFYYYLGFLRLAVKRCDKAEVTRLMRGFIERSILIKHYPGLLKEVDRIIQGKDLKSSGLGLS
jgi:hypothetical protein